MLLFVKQRLTHPWADITCIANVRVAVLRTGVNENVSTEPVVPVTIST